LKKSMTDQQLAIFLGVTVVTARELVTVPCFPEYRTRKTLNAWCKVAGLEELVAHTGPNNVIQFPKLTEEATTC
jgi:hypothetical protein